MTERHRGAEDGGGHHTHRGRMAAGAGSGRGGDGTRSRPTSVQSMVAPSMLTMERTTQHHQGALRAAEVSARVRVFISTCPLPPQLSSFNHHLFCF